MSDWCDICDAPQLVLPNGEHACGEGGAMAGPPWYVDLDDFHKQLKNAFENGGESAMAAVDDMLNQCHHDGGECCTCSWIICPFHELLHFHHDGCPACESSYAPEAI